MSLTIEAYNERKWGRFPALRKALSDKEVPSHYFGMTSASDNMFDALNRLLQISVLAVEYDRDIKESAKFFGWQEMCGDLWRLVEEIESASLFFKEQSQKIKQLLCALEEN